VIGMPASGAAVGPAFLPLWLLTAWSVAAVLALLAPTPRSLRRTVPVTERDERRSGADGAC
jgi:hypothetical protein